MFMRFGYAIVFVMHFISVAAGCPVGAATKIINQCGYPDD